MNVLVFSTICFIGTVFPPSISFGQLKAPDSLYFAKSKAIEIISSPSKLAGVPSLEERAIALTSAVQGYLELNTTYRLTSQDLQQMMSAALLTENPSALTEATRNMVLQSGHSVEEVVQDSRAFTQQVYNTSVPMPKQGMPMHTEYQRLLGESDSLVVVAKMQLEWQSIVFIESLIRSDIDFRTFVKEYLFKDSSQLPKRNSNLGRYTEMPLGKLLAMKAIDSAHFTALYEYIKEEGFPGVSKAGYHAHSMWLLMWHSVALLNEEDLAVQAKYVDMWKYLLPIFYENSLNGEFTHGRYQRFHNFLITVSRDILNLKTSPILRSFTITIDCFEMAKYSAKLKE